MCVLKQGGEVHQLPAMSIHKNPFAFAYLSMTFVVAVEV